MRRDDIDGQEISSNGNQKPVNMILVVQIPDGEMISPKKLENTG